MEEPNLILEAIAKAIQRVVITISFYITKQPARIGQILEQVYPNNEKNVDNK